MKKLNLTVYATVFLFLGLLVFTAGCKKDFNPKEIKDFNQVNLVANNNEYNNAFFAIEKSSDGKTFETLAIIKSNGNNTNTQNYEAVDEKPFAITFYRLKQTDINGKFSYSSIVTIKLSNAKEGITIFPNPTSNEAIVSLILNKAEKVVFSLIDTKGNSVISPIEKQCGKGVSKVTLNTSQIENGIYFLQVSTGSKTTRIKTVILH